ncbi:MAG: hypothetical protein ACR2OJ_00605 [Hyphomicrobiales bacterium]
MKNPKEPSIAKPNQAKNTNRGEGPDWWYEVALHWPRYVAGIIIGIALAEFAIIGDWINFQWTDWFN